ncbi:hypothetical protein GCM10025867_04150 [Frondihabitans sucicola]|uniref:Polysaccharide chain length determinant N-terminal domain-containing protein n=1 Tax=Frondihabitans sucicola TaxID=1268041 RepID=A0ABM8GIK0_9MICO|nr:Wzz/FepE/Etk N-terminal domain-containing protein [Frondihabitans sucicola]BDZ48174.1 hypothetical protein GCM10025867_04150 [Frondihabitans sucicola]
MQLSDYIRIIRRRWLTIVVFTLVGLLAAGTYALLAPKSYVSSTRLFVNVQSSESNSAVDIVQGSSAAQQKVRSYADVVTSAGVLEPVIKDLHLDTSVQQLASRVTATAQVNSVIITIAVSGESAAETATIANAIGKSFSTIVVDSLESPASGGPSLVKIVTVEPAIPATMPASPRTG